jgi:hypothetical protein
MVDDSQGGGELYKLQWLTTFSRMALCRGRPSHIVDDDWNPDPLTADGDPDSEDEDEGDTTIEGGTDVAAGGVAFEWMVSLTRILSEILKRF